MRVCMYVQSPIQRGLWKTPRGIAHPYIYTFESFLQIRWIASQSPMEQSLRDFTKPLNRGCFANPLGTSHTHTQTDMHISVFFPTCFTKPLYTEALWIPQLLLGIVWSVQIYLPYTKRMVVKSPKMSSARNQMKCPDLHTKVTFPSMPPLCGPLSGVKYRNLFAWKCTKCADLYRKVMFGDPSNGGEV